MHLLVRFEKMRHELLLELRDLLESNQTIFVSLQNGEDDIIRLMAVVNLVLVIEH
jgi:hypothetical protein